MAGTEDRKLAARDSAAGAIPLVDLARRSLFALGLAISITMVLRSQTGGDQYFLLTRGWLLFTEGWIVPFGNPMSGGGYQPGSLTSVLVGLPLYLWEDFRAINFSILILHVVAYLLLDRTLAPVLGPRGRLLLCLFYWINPWRMYFSAHLWNPNWLFLFGVIHLWTAFRSRQRPSALHSLLHVLCLGIVCQLHGSFLILAIASVFLWARGYLRLHWPAAVLGGLIVAASLGPWALTALEHPEILPVKEGFLGRGLVTVYPVGRGILYWLRYPAMYYGRRMTPFDFTPLLGATPDLFLTPILLFLTRVLGSVTVLAPLLANLWLWRRRPQLRFAKAGSSQREWVHGYVRWAFLAAVLSFSLSPTTIVMWQVLIVLHAAVLPPVLWLDALWRTKWSRHITTAVRIHAIALLVVAASMAVASPLYRNGGREEVRIKIEKPVEMLDRLGVVGRTPVEIAPDGLSTSLLEGPEGWVAGLEAGDRM